MVDNEIRYGVYLYKYLDCLFSRSIDQIPRCSAAYLVCAPLLAAGYLTYNVPLIEEHKIVNRNNNRKVQVSNYVTRQAVWQLGHIRQRKDRYGGYENRNGL